MDKKIIIITIIIIQIITLFIIKWYSYRLLSQTNSKECIDILNKPLLTLQICLWNISHIIVFIVYCIILRPKTIYDHLNIMLLGVIWYLIQSWSRNDTRGDTTKCPDVVYKNILYPRLDDFIYNTIGQLIYISITNFL